MVRMEQIAAQVCVVHRMTDRLEVIRRVPGQVRRKDRAGHNQGHQPAPGQKGAPRVAIKGQCQPYPY